jgi:hypothetical protein
MKSKPTPWKPRTSTSRSGRPNRQAIKLAVDIGDLHGQRWWRHVVLGVRDRVVGRAKAILGVPPETLIHQLKRDIYERTAPKLTPDIHELTCS